MTFSPFRVPKTFTKELATLMAVNCVPQTMLKDFHAKGQLSEADMNALNKDITNKLYTFMMFLLNRPIQEQNTFMALMRLQKPAQWHSPTMDRQFAKKMKMALPARPHPAKG